MILALLDITAQLREGQDRQLVAASEVLYAAGDLADLFGAAGLRVRHVEQADVVDDDQAWCAVGLYVAGDDALDRRHVLADLALDEER